ADLAEPGYVAERAASILLAEETWAAYLAALERDAVERLGAHYAGVREAWRAQVEEKLAAHRVPAPLGSDTAAPPTLVLDDFLAEAIDREVDALHTRISVGAAAAGVGAAA